MESNKKNRPIAVFDSGMGGVSVLRELLRVMPNENYIYFGDSKNAPYGTKTLKEVQDLTIGHAINFFNDGAKGLVVACNTATSAAVRLLREQFTDIPIVGIEPAVKPATLCKDHPRVLVMATPMTIHQEKFNNLMAHYSANAEILPLACPGLMEFVERGILDGDELEAYLSNLLKDYIQNPVDAVVTGCTHYIFVGEMILKCLGPQAKLFDGGAGTAREMKRRLQEADLLTTRTTKGTIDFRNSLPAPEEEILFYRLLHQENFFQ